MAKLYVRELTRPDERYIIFNAFYDLVGLRHDLTSGSERGFRGIDLTETMLTSSDHVRSDQAIGYTLFDREEYLNITEFNNAWSYDDEEKFLKSDGFMRMLDKAVEILSTLLGPGRGLPGWDPAEIFALTQTYLERERLGLPWIPNPPVQPYEAMATGVPITGGKMERRAVGNLSRSDIRYKLFSSFFDFMNQVQALEYGYERMFSPTHVKATLLTPAKLVLGVESVGQSLFDVDEYRAIIEFNALVSESLGRDIETLAKSERFMMLYSDAVRIVGMMLSKGKGIPGWDTEAKKVW